MSNDRISCPECGSELINEEGICTECGTKIAIPLSSSDTKTAGKSKPSVGKKIGTFIRDIVIIGLCSLLILLMFSYLLTDNEANAKLFGISIGVSTSSANSSAGKEGVDPDLVKFLDEYEKFMDDYCAFMAKVNSGNYNLNDYTKLLNDLSSYENALSKLNTSNMSSTDYAYYVEVITRVNNKVAQSIG